MTIFGWNMFSNDEHLQNSEMCVCESDSDIKVKNT